jgi:hypothetical protein
VTLRGTRELLPAYQWLPRRAVLSVTVSAPIQVTGSGWPEIVRIRDAARVAIDERLGE